MLGKRKILICFLALLLSFSPLQTFAQEQSVPEAGTVDNETAQENEGTSKDISENVNIVKESNDLPPEASKGEQASSEALENQTYEVFEQQSVDPNGEKVLFIKRDDSDKYGIYSTAWNGYSKLANLLVREGYNVSEDYFPTISIEDIIEYDIVVFTADSKRNISSSEIEAFRSFVKQGGGLWILGQMSNKSTLDLVEVNQVAKPFGITFEDGLLYHDSNYEYYSSNWSKGKDFPIITDIREHELTEGVYSFMLNYGTTIKVTPPAKAIAYSDSDAWLETNPVSSSNGWRTTKDSNDKYGKMPVLAVSQFGRGKVAAIGDAGVFINETDWGIGGFDHEELTLNTLKWLADTEKGGKVSFVPYYPKSNVQLSEVMTGGKAVRYYRLVDENDAPLREAVLLYKINGSEKTYKTESDENGYVPIETDKITSDRKIRIDVVSTDYEWIDEPEFSVVIDKDDPRKLTQKWTLNFGGGVSAGVGGVGVKLGPAELDTIGAKVRAGQSTQVGIEYETDDKYSDLTMSALVASELGGEAQAGLFLTAWKNKDALAVDAGISVNSQLRQGVGVKNTFHDFNNSEDDEYYKNLLNSSVYMLDTALIASPKLVDNKLFMLLHNKAMEKLDLYDDMETINDLQGKLGVGAGLKFTASPPGAGVGVEGVLANAGVDAIVSYEQAYKEKEDKYTQSYGMMFQAEHEYLKFGLFGQGAAAETPTFKSFFNNVTNTDLGAKYIIDRKFVTEKEDNNLEKIELKTAIQDEKDTSMIGKEIVTQEHTVELEGSALDTVMKQSELFKNFEKTLWLEGPTQDFYNEVSRLKQNVPWKVEETVSELVSIPFEVELTLGAKLGFDLLLEGQYDKVYTKEEGIISAGTNELVLAKYEDDSWNEEHEQQVTAIFKEYSKALGQLADDFIETIENTIEDGVEYVKDQVKKIGAGIKKGINGFKKGAKSFISKVKDFKIFSISTLNGEANTVSTIYNVYIEDEEGNEIKEFADTPLELTIQYEAEAMEQLGLVGKEQGLSIYRWDGESGYYARIPSTVDTASGTVTASVTKGGQYVVAFDEEVPVIQTFTYADSYGKKVVTADIKDNFSSINKEDVEFLLNGEKVEADEYQFDLRTGKFVYEAAELADGEYSAKLYVTDQAGNKAEADLIFTVATSKLEIVNPSAKVLPNGNAEFKVTVDSGRELEGVYLKYRDADSDAKPIVIPMFAAENGSFTGEVSRKNLANRIYYQMIARDESGNEIKTEEAILNINDEPLSILKYQNNVDINKPVYIQFNKNIAEGMDYELIEVVEESNQPVAVYKKMIGDTLILTPTISFKPNTSYRIIIPQKAVQDKSNRSLEDGEELSFVAKNNNQVVSDQVFAEETVASSKEWTIRFNQPVNLNTVNKENIYVEDQFGQVIPVKLTLSIDRKSVMVEPAVSYRAGKYILFVESSVTNDSGGKMNKRVLKPFNVE